MARGHAVDRFHWYRHLHQRLQRIHQGHRPIRAARQPGLGLETGFEAATAPYLFHVLGQGGIGFSVFGMDGNQDSQANRDAIAAHAANFKLLAPMQRILAQAAFDGRLQAVAEQPGAPQRTLRFGEWQAKVSFGAPMWGDAPPILPGNDDHAGRLLVAQLGPEEFLVTGMAARIEFFREAADTRRGQLLRVEQGGMSTGAGRWKSSSTATRPTTASTSGVWMQTARCLWCCGCGWVLTEPC